MQKRRWYDNLDCTRNVISKLQNLEDQQKKLIAIHIINAANCIKYLYKKDIEPDLSIGLNRVLGLYKYEKKRRWYDKDNCLNFAIKTISTLPQNDYHTIMKTLNSIL